MAPPAWRLDPVHRTAERLSDCPLSLNGIAKGYIVERACDAAMAEVPGIAGLMLNVGGDLRFRGAIEGTIGIAAPWADSESSEPLGYIEVKDRSVATSGSSAARVPDRRPLVLAHLRSPHRPAGRPRRRRDRRRRAVRGCRRLRQGVQRARAGGVRAPGAIDAGLEFLIVGKDGRTTRSDGWHRYERPRPGWLASADEPNGLRRQGPAGETGRPGEDGRQGVAVERDFELVVNFEINHPEAEAGRYRRPYVVVWVEDKDGNIGPDRVVVGLDGRCRSVPMDARPEALVCRRRGAQAATTRRNCSSRSPGRRGSPASTR